MRATILKIARDAYRAIGAEGFARIDFLLARRRRSSCPRSTRSRASPRSACSRRCRPTGGYSFADVCEKVVDLALERHAARAGGTLEPRGPAAMTVRRRAAPYRRARHGADAGRSAGVGRAHPGPGRRGARAAPEPRPRSTASPPTSAFGFERPPDRRARRSPARRRSATASGWPRARTSSRSDRPDRGAPRRQLPAVAAADVSVGLPGTVTVDVDERQPILVWRVGDAALLRRRRRACSSPRRRLPPGDLAGLPVIADDRLTSRALRVGSTLDPVDLDAARRLASLTPAQVGSAAAGLSAGVTDQNGFTLSSVPKGGWVAVFGFYGPSQRTPDLVPAQVVLLQQLLPRRASERRDGDPRRRDRRDVHPQAEPGAVGRAVEGAVTRRPTAGPPFGGWPLVVRVE